MQILGNREKIFSQVAVLSCEFYYQILLSAAPGLRKAIQKSFTFEHILIKLDNFSARLNGRTFN